MIPIPLAKDTDVEEHYQSFAKNLKGRIERVAQNGARFKNINNGQPIKPKPKQKKFLVELAVEDRLKELICAPPDKLENQIDTFTSFDGGALNVQSYFNRLLYAIFVRTGYEDYLDKWDFINRLNLDTCCYCNRNYTYSIAKDLKIKPEIDHFYPKSKYPFLGLSFYNLIPSCQTCNGLGAKKQHDPRDKGMVSPYLLKHDHFKFTYTPLSSEVLTSIGGSGKIRISLADKIDGNTDVFRLSELYEKHEDHVLELIFKSQISYSKPHRDYLKGYNGLDITDGEIDRMLVGNYTNLAELHKRPLAKLYRDIALELKLIKE